MSEGEVDKFQEPVLHPQVARDELELKMGKDFSISMNRW